MDVNSLFDVKVSETTAGHVRDSARAPWLTHAAPPQGKVVLVTGGAKGIGRMISEGFVANGAKIYISSRDGKACDQAAKELTALGTRTAGTSPLTSPTPLLLLPPQNMQ